MASKDLERRSITAAEDRCRLDMLTREILERKGRVGRSLFEIGTRLTHIAEHELWRAAGHRTFEDYLARDVGFSRSTAYRLMRIARAFDARVVARHGIEKLDLAVRYLNTVKRQGHTHRGMNTPLRVRADDGRFVAVTLNQATAEEIRGALATLREQPAPKRIPAALRQRMRALAEHLPEAPPGAHRGSRIRLRRANDGRVAITFHAIAADDLAAFVQAIQQHLETDS